MTAVAIDPVHIASDEKLRATTIDLRSDTVTKPTPDGILTWAEVKKRIAPKIYYRAQTGLVSLENTNNMAGGSVYPQEVSDEICDGAHDAGLRVHLDGARVFNAATALGKSVAEITR